MRIVALISGGKDSCFNMMQCVAAGHEIVALANLQPSNKDEIDSYMYQTVGHDGISLYADSMGLPLFRRIIQGEAVSQTKQYLPTDGDEVEDLYLLLQEIKESVPFDGVSVGAILSDYQRIRVENVCSRLGCVSLSFLWRRNQTELLQEMIDCGIKSILIKTASLGLDPNIHLGQTLQEIQPHLLKLKDKYSINVCGEGGEYETFTLDCPLFVKKIVLDESKTVIHSDDAIAPVGYLRLIKMHLENKPLNTRTVTTTKRRLCNGNFTASSKLQLELLEGVPVKAPIDYLSELADCKKSDCCDGREEICPHHEMMEKPTEASTFSSNSSNCSGGGPDEDRNAQISSTFQLVPPTSINSNNGNLLIPECLELSKLTVKRDTEICPVVFRLVENEGGWIWISGISGSGPNPMTNALDKLNSVLIQRDLTLRSVVSISMFVSSMDDYASYNEEYLKYFSSQPPVRACVELPLPIEQSLILKVIGFSGRDSEDIRKCMHVQSISHWAPANIGPYSQSQHIRDIIHIAGQIGLVPGSMKLVESGGARLECKLALRHLNRILRSTDPKLELRHVVQGICFVTNSSFILKCREEWEKRSTNGLVEYVVVSRLPRDASVEWCVWAHMHNSAFGYEETGCYIGSGVKVKLFRRWSFETRVSVVSCKASICDQTGKLGEEELSQIFEYAITKLRINQEAVSNCLEDGSSITNNTPSSNSECSLGIFYKVGIDINPNVLCKILMDYSNIAFSILPVIGLVQEYTVLSITGIRY